MTEQRLRVVFMGCPDFAVPALQTLAADPAFEVVAVYCMPDRPKGRGKKPAPTPVKAWALTHGYQVHTPATFRNAPDEIATLRDFAPDYLVVVAYGLILPQAVLDIPKLAPVNLHASILPEFRGPAPIHQAMLLGRPETGNTVMLMNKGMDEGDILAIGRTPITTADDLGSLHDRLSLEGATLLRRTLIEFAAGRITPTPQNHAAASYTSKITPQTARIDWQKPAHELRNLIYAMSPFPGAWFADGEERIKVFRATVDEDATSQVPGTVLSQSPGNGIRVACGAGTSLRLLELQRAGKGRLCCADFLRGCQLRSAILDLPGGNENFSGA
ncbi:MAG TPA: methionyl-tRNA formyltransferase [Candidatus Rifleibacterium sp.]|nr:methionyl-tRNA formyltransferase [Candidatus Rifleibacterium sp.]HPT46261.1 methionyl-tRNA formyltransferase [Candidatus Rifleibacterium sp.]